MKNIHLLVALFLAIPCALVAVGVDATGVGQPAPALSLPTANGEIVALDQLRGKVVYVDFWASWCGPCRKSFPWMTEMHKKYGPAGLTVVAVNVDKKRPDADRFLRATPAAFTVVYDPAGDTPSAWNVKSMPSSFLIDAKGNVAMVEAGFGEKATTEIENRIKSMVGAK